MGHIFIYSHDIKVYRDDTHEKVMEFPYGEIDSKKLVYIKKVLAEKGDIKESSNFPKTKKILNKPINLKGFPPRIYQNEALNRFFAKGRKTGILKAPTGAGKGSIIAYMIAEKNLATLIIVPTADLVYQTAERIRSILDIEYSLVGEMGEKKRFLDAPIIVSTWQSLATPATLENMKHRGFGMLICDEVHKASAPILNKIISSLAIPFKYGMSATPYRTKKEQMDKVHEVLGDTIYSIDIEYLYKEKFLLRPEITFIKTELPISIESGIRYYFYEKIEKNEKMRYVFANKLFNDKKYNILAPKNRLIEDVVNNPLPNEWNMLADIAKKEYLSKLKKESEDEDEEFKKKLGLSKSGIELYSRRMDIIVNRCSQTYSKKDEKSIVLFHTKKAGVEFGERMRSLGFDNILILNGDSPTKREDIKRISKGEIKNYICVSTVSLLSEGNDFPELRRIGVGAPAYSPFTDVARLIQIVGRAVRPDPKDPNKKPIIDIFDDIAEGWVGDKQKIAYENLISEFHPKIIGESPVQIKIDSLFNNENKDDILSPSSVTRAI